MKISKKRIVPLVLGLILGAATRLANAHAVEADPARFYGVVDLVAEFGIENPLADSGRMRVRSFEFGATSLVDAMWLANVNFGGHDESGVIDFELHEAFLSSEHLLPDTQIKAGRFYLGLGTLNREHSYDWPFMSAPKFQTQFFGKESIADAGLEITYRVGSPIPIDFTLGISNGWNYSHRPTSGRRPLAPTHYVHPTILFLLGENRTLSIGVNYLGRTDADSVQTRLAGLDFTLRNRDFSHSGDSFLIQGELYHRIQSSSTLPLAEDVGGYLWAETALGQSRFSAGARFDAFTTLSLREANGDRRSNFDYGVTPIISFRASMMSTVRASYGYLVESRQGDNNHAEQKIEVQLIALLGESKPRVRFDSPSTD